MSKPNIDWTAMTGGELRELMDEGRDECDRRIRELGEALHGSPKGPGRPPKNGMRLTAADLKPADSDS